MRVATPASTAAWNGGRITFHSVALRDLDGVVVPARLGKAVGGEVPGAGRHRGEVGQVVALEALHAPPATWETEVRVLAGALHDPSPTRVAGDAHHGRERPVHDLAAASRARHLPSAGRVEVPARGLPEGMGKMVR